MIVVGAYAEAELGKGELSHGVIIRGKGKRGKDNREDAKARRRGGKMKELAKGLGSLLLSYSYVISNFCAAVDWIGFAGVVVASVLAVAGGAFAVAGGWDFAFVSAGAFCAGDWGGGFLSALVA